MKSIKKLIKKPVRIIGERVLDFRSAYYIKRNIRAKNTGVIRIGFIVQMAEVWDKEVRIYEELRTRADVETFLIVVPPYDLKTDKNTLSYENDPFLSIYPEAIKALRPDGNWIDIRKSIWIMYSSKDPMIIIFPSRLGVPNWSNIQNAVMYHMDMQVRMFLIGGIQICRFSGICHLFF